MKSDLIRKFKREAKWGKQWELDFSKHRKKGARYWFSNRNCRLDFKQATLHLVELGDS